MPEQITGLTHNAQHNRWFTWIAITVHPTLLASHTSQGIESYTCIVLNLCLYLTKWSHNIKHIVLHHGDNKHNI